MPYTPLNIADIVAGKPTKEELFQTIHDNMESFDDDIQSLQQTSKVDIFNIKMSGHINQYNSTELSEFIPVYKATVAGTLVNFLVTLLTASTSGNLEVEIEKSTDNGVNWTPLLSSPVTVTGTTVGSLSGAVNWTSPSAQDFAQNNLLRIQITGAQVDQGEFHISIYGEL